jgi:hypothetical protein
MKTNLHVRGGALSASVFLFRFRGRRQGVTADGVRAS